MTIRHELYFPIEKYATATSYVSSMTRYCGLASPRDFCLDIGFFWRDFVKGYDNLYERVAQIGGIDPDDLSKWAVRSVKRGRHAISGNVFSRGTLQRTKVRVCPMCLQEDELEREPEGVFRRYFWQLTAIRSCARHEMALLPLSTAKYTIDNYDFVGLVRKQQALIRKGSQPLGHTDFEGYAFNRVEGAQQHGFLDELSYLAATKLCETLGFVILFGPKAKIADASETDMHAAGQAGYDALSNGYEGLTTVLDDLRSIRASQTMRHKSDFGALYEWLRLSPFDAEVEPIRNVMREYIFEHYPIPHGYEILGRACERQFVFTVDAACKALGVERKRMGRYLVDVDSAKRNASVEGVTLTRPLDRNDISQIAAEMKGRATTKEALEILQVTQRTLQGLCSLGLVQQERDALDQRPKYSHAMLDLLLSSLTTKASRRPLSSKPTIAIIDVARRLRCRTAEIVSLIRANKLETVRGDVRVNGISGLATNLEEVRNALPNWVMSGITKAEAGSILRVSNHTINYLIAEGFLRSERMQNPNSRQSIVAITDCSIDAFLREYETMGHLAKRYNRRPGPFASHLKANGIYPIETPPSVGWFIQRRGLARRLAKVGIREPESPNASQARDLI